MRTPETPETQGGILSTIGERINWPATVAVSAAATIAASVAVHEIHFPDGSFMDGVQNFLTPDVFGTDYHTSTASHHSAHHIVHRRIEPGRSIDLTYLDAGRQEYARDFSQDPDAGEYVQPGRLSGMLKELSGNAKLGYDIVSIEVTGYASAEDNAESPDGGLITPSEKNLRLAQTRAADVMGELRQAIDDDRELSRATRGVTFKYGAPVEQQLTEEQLKKVESMAHSAGFSDAGQLVDAWNTGQTDVPEADSRALSDLLGKARKVDVYVRFGTSGDEVIDKKYCVNYDITDITTHKHHQRDPLPLPLPLLIPIPAWRRRKGKNADLGGPDDTANEPDAASPTPQSSTSGGTLASKTGTADGIGRERNYRMADILTGGIGALFVAGALFVNVSGENCHGDGHTPRPLLVDGVWESIDEGTNRGADVSHTVSIGIPFVSGAQINLGGQQPGSFWGYNGEKACEQTTPVITPAKPPKCSQVDIVRRNGKTVTKRTVYQAPPLSTRRIVKQHR